jgi:menaquinone-dependent protoporphyrinogen oxidase
MSTPVLVTYATKHGATAEIAERIARVLTRAGLAVDLVPVEEAPAPDGHGAVVLGAAIYMGMWRRGAKQYLTRHQEALAARPVWLFASGPTAEGDPEELVDGHVVQAALEPVIERISPRDITLFHGRIDPEHLGWFERFVIRTVGAEVGDHRDWDAIEAWAGEVAEALASDPDIGGARPGPAA